MPAKRPQLASVTSIDDITVIVPTRNVAHWLGRCLDAINACRPHEVIVVDGLSTDATREIAAERGARVLSDEGRGVSAARAIGAQAATTRYIAVIDADVVLSPNALERLLDEFVRGGYTGLQAGLRSVSDGGYWGQALVHHHRNSRSRNWFGVVATVFERTTLLEHGFDESFLSGEDVDLRWRLQRAGKKIGVSRETIVEHRFGSGWSFALGQWLADGRAGARMMTSHGLRSVGFLALPFMAGVRGVALSVARLQPQWIPYYVCYCVFNYVGISRQLVSIASDRMASRSG
jgi:glycosyltransferase involved in cell wall biosynthesis